MIEITTTRDFKALPQ